VRVIIVFEQVQKRMQRLPLVRPRSGRRPQTGLGKINGDLPEADFETTSSESVLDVTSGSASSDREQRQMPNRNAQNDYARLLKLREFHLRLFQKGDIRIGVLPQA
jgi:hypothetical protein